MTPATSIWVETEEGCATKDGKWSMVKVLKGNRRDVYEARCGSVVLRGGWRELRRAVECKYLPGEVRRMMATKSTVASS